MEPPRTDYDLQFRLFGLPVRIHPLFWVICLFLGMRSTIEDMSIWLLALACWVAAVFLSILVHELGHALPLAYYYGARTWIILYGVGGVAHHEPNYRKRVPGTWGTIAYTAAGPLAGFALAAVLLGVLSLCQVKVALLWVSFGDLVFLPYVYVDPQSFASVFSFLPVVVAYALYEFTFDILFVSILWGLINMLPVYPLDGGHIARGIFWMLDRRSGIANSLWLSVFTGGVIAVLGFLQWVNVRGMQGIPFTTLLFGYLAFQSYQTLNHYR